jgi:diadenosine tetraphosphate (Ap4A) HIT family hydrolase
LSRRFLPASFDCTAAEQAAVMELVRTVKKLLDLKSERYNVGFNAGGPQPARQCLATT